MKGVGVVVKIRHEFEAVRPISAIRGEELDSGAPEIGLTSEAVGRARLTKTARLAQKKKTGAANMIVGGTRSVCVHEILAIFAVLPAPAVLLVAGPGIRAVVVILIVVGRVLAVVVILIVVGGGTLVVVVVLVVGRRVVVTAAATGVSARRRALARSAL
jgi:hypothetical protein